MSGEILFGIAVPWLIMGLMAVLVAWIGLQLVQQNGRMLARLEALEQDLGDLRVAPTAAPPPTVPSAPPTPQGLPVGTPAPPFALPDLNGARRSLADFRGKKLLAIFFNPRCGFCTRMAPGLAALPVDGTGGRPVPLVITTGDAGENRKLFAEHGVKGPVLLQDGMQVAGQYQCNGTPMGYLIDEESRIASPQAVGADALLALLQNAGTPQAAERRCKCGKPLSECGKGDCDCRKQKARAAAARQSGN
jgi:peroxiredoxin